MSDANVKPDDDYLSFMDMPEPFRRCQFERLNDALAELAEAYAEAAKSGMPCYRGCLAAIAKDRLRLKERVAELEKVVAGLPKTADGVALTIGDECWHPDRGRFRIDYGYCKDGFGRYVADGADDDNDDLRVSIGACYSTEALAAAAATRERGE